MPKFSVQLLFKIATEKVSKLMLQLLILAQHQFSCSHHQFEQILISQSAFVNATKLGFSWQNASIGISKGNVHRTDGTCVFNEAALNQSS